MADANGDATDLPAFKGPEAPCVYCGKVIDRGSDRCPHCRTSYSLAVRKASREVVGEWFYLDPRNPSGRGVTFEALIKMIEKGRIKPDSVVRGPTTHYDWMYAAETPRLAKYLGVCPHCFAEAKPEDTYCTHCQLNMNERPAEARPGASPEAIQEPYHKAEYEMEQRLAEAAKAGEEPPTPVPRPAPAAKPEPKPSATAAAAAAALAESGVAERSSRVPAAARRSGPKLWIVLVLTWVTLIPILILGYVLPIPLLHDALHAVVGSGAGSSGEAATSEPSPPQTPAVDQQWLKRQLALADAAEQKKDYQAAIRIYETIIEKTGDESWRQRIVTLREKPKQERRKRLQKLRDRLEMAEDLAAQKRYDDALAVLRNISREDRSLLGSLGIGVKQMETSIQTAKAEDAKRQQKKKELTNRLAYAKSLREAGKLKEALAAYRGIGRAFDARLVAAHIDLESVTEELKTEIAQAETASGSIEDVARKVLAEVQAREGDPDIPIEKLIRMYQENVLEIYPDTPAAQQARKAVERLRTGKRLAGTEPPPKETSGPPEEAAKEIADLMAKAADLEKAEKFGEALTVLGQIKEQFDETFWPDNLQRRIDEIKAKKEATEFFGLE